jgi:hypothetical protein
MKELLFNKKGHLDVRDTLSIWSVIKEVIDIMFVVLGANKFYHTPAYENPLLFAFWIFTIIKMCIDLPLSIAYLMGKWKHAERKRRKNVRQKTAQNKNKEGIL